MGRGSRKYQQQAMAYTLQAVIGKAEHLAAALPAGAKLVRLPQQMGLIPISAAVRSRYGILSVPLIDEGITSVPPGLHDLVHPLVGGGAIAYVEAEFFGGDGTQAYILWDQHGEHSAPVLHPSAINEVLRRLGVKRTETTDEFDAVDLARHRHTDRWQYDARGELMPTDDVKALVSEFIEKVWNKADMAALDELTLATYTYHLGGQPARDRAAMQQFVQAVHVAFPDWRVQIQTIVAEGDSVAVQWNGRVTHQGPFQGLPPTGKAIDVAGINLYLIQDGKIAQEWEQMDSLGMLQQLGVLPAPPPQGK